MQFYCDNSQSSNERIRLSSYPKHWHGKLALDHKYLHSVINAVNESKEILILGPGSAKLELIKHAHKHDATIAEKIVGVDTVDHPTDKEILAYARKFFYKVDQMI